MLFALALTSAACAVVPALLTLVNVSEYQPPPAAAEALPPVTVIVPMRDEEAGIAACLESVLAAAGVVLEVIAMDDGSIDATAEVVQGMAAADTRVKLLHADPLPAGWNGKQHACWLAAQAATGSVLCFLDADVGLERETLARCLTALQRDQAALLSGFPQELTGTWLERLLIPLIHFILLGLLPIRLLRTTTTAGYAAGCGQFLMVDRTAYMQSGGHAAIRHTMHDGLLLPRLLRQHGFRTTLVDLTDLASCRMYRSASSTWNGLAKNATEGIAAPARIVPMTLFLGIGQVLPLPLLWLAWQHTRFIFPFLGPPVRIGVVPVWAASVAVALSYLPRIVNTVRYRQSWFGAALHPLGVLVLLVLQWYALGRKLLRKPAGWKAREYSAN